MSMNTEPCGSVWRSRQHARKWLFDAARRFALANFAEFGPAGTESWDPVGLLSQVKRRRNARHAAHNLQPSGGSHSMGDSMRSNDRAVSPPFAQTQPDTIYTELETRLLEAVADFGIDDLSQMLDVATAIRRARRL